MTATLSSKLTRFLGGGLPCYNSWCETMARQVAFSVGMCLCVWGAGGWRRGGVEETAEEALDHWWDRGAMPPGVVWWNEEGEAKSMTLRNRQEEGIGLPFR